MSKNETPSLGDARREALADTLVGVRRGSQAPADAMVFDIPTPQEAYRAQAAVSDRCGWFVDGPPAYWKSGGPSRDAVLTHAPLPPAGVLTSPADMRGWPFAMRGIEAEIALRIGSAVNAEMAQSLDVESARALITGMAVSIEIVDSRWLQGMETPNLHKLADLQSHGALALGEWVPYRAQDWAQQTCEVRVGQQAVVRRQGSHSLGDPAWLLPQWLRHATTAFGTVPAGSVVTTGTWVGILPAQAGDAVHVVFEGIGEASVQL